MQGSPVPEPTAAAHIPSPPPFCASAVQDEGAATASGRGARKHATPPKTTLRQVETRHIPRPFPPSTRAAAPSCLPVTGGLVSSPPKASCTHGSASVCRPIASQGALCARGKRGRLPAAHGSAGGGGGGEMLPSRRGAWRRYHECGGQTAATAPHLVVDAPPRRCTEHW